MPAAALEMEEWNASIEVCRNDCENYPHDMFASYPLRWQVTEDEGDYEDVGFGFVSPPLWVYLVAFGGGIVAGDQTRVKMDIQPESAAVLVSQAMTKVFKKSTVGAGSQRVFEFNVKENSFFMHAPHPTALYADAHFKQETFINIHKTSSLCFVDWFAGGRGETQDGLWNFSSYDNLVLVSVDNGEGQPPVLALRSCVETRGGSPLQQHLHRYNVFAMVILYGEAVQEISADLLSEYNKRKTFSEIELSGTKKGGAEGYWIDEDNDILISCEPAPYEGMVVLRIGAVDFEEAASFLDDHLGTIDGVLGESPFECMLFGGGGGGGRVEAKEKENSKVSLLGGEKEGEELLGSKPLDACEHCTDQLPLIPPPHLDGQKGSDMDYLVWQLVDSKLPTGGFAHSNSLEAALHVGIVKRGDVESLKSYVSSAVEHMAGSSIPFLMSACKQWESSENLQQLESLFHASTSSSVVRSMSISLGKAMISLAQGAFSDLPQFEAKNPLDNLSSLTGHYVIVFGALCSALGISVKGTAKMFLFTLLRSMLLAAVRLNLVGPMQAEKVQVELSTLLSPHLDVLMQVPLCRAHCVSPLVSVVEGIHSRLYSRVFAS